MAPKRRLLSDAWIANRTVSEMWTDINAKTTKYRKKAFIRASFHNIFCPHCHSTRFVDHPMLYHSPDHELMVQCVMMDHDERFWHWTLFRLSRTAPLARNMNWAKPINIGLYGPSRNFGKRLLFSNTTWTTK